MYYPAEILESLKTYSFLSELSFVDRFTQVMKCLQSKYRGWPSESQQPETPPKRIVKVIVDEEKLQTNEQGRTRTIVPDGKLS